MEINSKFFDFSTPESRKSLAKFVTGIIESGRRSPFFHFHPYCPNSGDDRYFVVDSNNDWRLKFPEDDKHTFEIIYRYQCDKIQAEQALGPWLVFALIGDTDQPLTEHVQV